jgi:hypothetical protein
MDLPLSLTEGLQGGPPGNEIDDGHRERTTRVHPAEPIEKLKCRQAANCLMDAMKCRHSVEEFPIEIKALKLAALVLFKPSYAHIGYNRAVRRAPRASCRNRLFKLGHSM